jgi:aminoethylphosphonate catabolism LysR family transcriptional regulator
MNFMHLRAFHMVATERSFTRAAQILDVSQPTLSAQVKSLEDAYGVRLLDRRKHEVVPNDIGKEVLAVTREIFTLEDALESMLVQNRELQSGRLRVGADAPRHVVPVLDRLMRLHPGLTVTLSTGNAKRVLEGLLDSETDVAIVALPKARYARLYTVPFCSYSLVAFVAQTHPWAKRTGISLKEFDGERVVVREASSLTRQMLMRALRGARSRPASLVEIDNREASREAVARGIGIGVMSAIEFPSADKRCVAVPIDDGRLELTEYVACLEQRRNVATVREFFRVAGEYGNVAPPMRGVTTGARRPTARR